MQGSRLTAYELHLDQIPSTLIADSMVAMLMEKKQIGAVIVGADRVRFGFYYTKKNIYRVFF